MALTKSNISVMDWTVIAVQSVQVSPVISVAGNYDTTLHIDCACAGSVASFTGTELFVQMRGQADVNDSWTTLTRFAGPAVSAPLTLAVTTSFASGVNSIPIALSTVSLKFGKQIMIEDGTVANSEIAYVVASNSTGLMTILDPLTHPHTSTALIYSSDLENAQGECVIAAPVSIPFTADSVRVLINNNLDVSANRALVKIRMSRVTAI